MTDKTDMAESRTDWAEDRTLLANERTYAGWLRTGMAAVALALGTRALFRSFDPTWLPKAVASIFVLTAIGIFISAWRRACATRARLTDHQADPQSDRHMGLTAAVLSIGAGATGLILLWL
ncbi:YidH family protein [Lutimaribacter marinistellae]|uniref:YidH family protein n=1 Tax=Lutimaribacter marinistellae TaxID=1820329 RepID=A0ABV7TEF3_9RHOB